MPLFFLPISYVLNDIVGALNTTCYVFNNQVDNVVIPNITKNHFHYFKKVATFVLRYFYKCLKIKDFSYFWPLKDNAQIVST